MRRVEVILAAALVIPLAGCALSGKPKPVATPPAPPQPVAAAPVPQPLSIPQTRAKLPDPQPLDQKALVTATPVETPAPAAPKPPAPATRRTTTPPQPRPDPPPQPEVSRPPIQEILPADVQKQLQGSAQKHKVEARTLLAQAQRRRLNTREKRTVTDIAHLLKASEDAEKSGDMRSADEFAEKAAILAKELQGGK